LAGPDFEVLIQKIEATLRQYDSEHPVLKDNAKLSQKPYPQNIRNSGRKL